MKILTPEELFAEWRKTHSPDYYWEYMPVWNEDSIQSYAKYYTQALVESMTDDVIDPIADKKCLYAKTSEDYYYEGKNKGFKYGAKWLREELIKKNKNFEG